MSLWPSLLAVAAILLVSTFAGRILALALFPTGAGWSLERWGWSMAMAVLLLPLNVCLSLALGVRPGWISFLVLTGVGVALAWRFTLPRSDLRFEKSPGPNALSGLLLAVTAAGVVISLVWNLEEPLASNDFFAIWGLKGKSIYGDAGIPRRLFDWPEYAFSNPAYPIGLPLLYAGIASLLGRWEDHAMALVFPFFQIATLVVLVGWLKRRGSPISVALAASALVANFGLLYSPLMTGGMADVPASFTFLLFGAAFCDSLDRTDEGCLRRLSLAALLAAGTKNEGVFLLGTAFALLMLRSARRGERPSWMAAAAIAFPGIGSFLLHRLVLGKHALRAFDFGILWRPDFPNLVRDALREAFVQLVVPSWPALAALTFLIVFARRTSEFGFLLALAGASLAIYLLLPAFCTLGPAWLVHWTVGRITAALAPLVAAGVAAGWGVRAAKTSSLEEVN